MTLNFFVFVFDHNLKTQEALSQNRTQIFCFENWFLEPGLGLHIWWTWLVLGHNLRYLDIKHRSRFPIPSANESILWPNQKKIEFKFVSRPILLNFLLPLGCTPKYNTNFKNKGMVTMYYNKCITLKGFFMLLDLLANIQRCKKFFFVKMDP